MCGIAGFVQQGKTHLAASALHAACHRLRHRGPDQQGVWIAPSRHAGLAAVRLAVLDPTPAADQPMSRNRCHLAYNGEVYNFRSIRKELESAGESFATNGDTEVVLAACRLWGTDALRRFNGMWALAFYDEEKESGFIARDRFGIKPLFYSDGGNTLTFASEIHAFRELQFTGSALNKQALMSHLVFGYIPDPHTILEGIHRLPPGHYVSFERERIRAPVRFYQISDQGGENGLHSYGAARARVRRALADAVTRRRVADVPIGSFLSGGIDSSIVTLHLAESQGRPVKTFSVSFPDQSGYDESAFARLVSKQLGTDHHELQLTESEVLASLPAILDHLHEPVGDSSIIPTTLLAACTREQVTVALSGDGADELFGGYWRYLGHTAARNYRLVPRSLRHAFLDPLMRSISASKSTILGNRARQARKLLRSYEADELDAHLGWSRILPPDCEQIFDHPGAAAEAVASAHARARLLTSELKDDSGLNRILAFDLQYQLPVDMLQKVDLASMMHSLEVRVPFLDHEVVELALKLPASHKIHGGLRKRILVDAYRGRLPDEVLDRSKQGFEVPVGEYLRGPLREMFLDTVTERTVESIGGLSHAAVRSIYKNHCDRKVECADLLFALLSLCWWHSRWL